MGRAYLAVSVVTLLWAGNFTAGKIATEEFDPYFIAAVRVLLSAGVFTLLLPRGRRGPSRAEVGTILPLALTGVVLNQICFAAGIERTTPSHSAVIHALMPAMVAVMARLLIRERLGPLGTFGLGLAVSGALVVVLGASREEIRGTLTGDLLTFVGVWAFALYMVQGRRVLGSSGSFRTVALAFQLGAPFVIPSLVWGLLHTEWARVTWKGVLALSYMFFLANLVCYTLHFFSLSHLKAGQVAVFSDFQPALGIAISILAGKDRLSLSLGIGAAVALLGIVLVQVHGPRGTALKRSGGGDTIEARAGLLSFGDHGPPARSRGGPSAGNPPDRELDLRRPPPGAPPPV